MSSTYDDCFPVNFLPGALGLILTRIRFRASDFGQIDFSSKNKSRSCKSKEASCAKSDPEMVLGSIVFVLVLIQQLGLWTQKIQPTSGTRIAAAMPGVAKRRAECTSAGTGPKHPSLR